MGNLLIIGLLGLMPNFLDKTVDIKIQDLLITGYWEHENSDGCDYSCRTKGNPYKEVSENLYKGPCDIRNAFKLWEKSPTHKAILDKSFDHLVLKGEKAKDGTCYLVYEIASD